MQGSPLPVLPIRPLAKAGVFASPEDGGLVERWAIRVPGLLVFLHYMAAMESVLCVAMGAGDRKDFLLPVVPVRVGLGIRRFWECLQCGVRCEYLVLARTGFLCRTCYRRSGFYAKAHADALLFEAENAILRGSCTVAPADPVPPNKGIAPAGQRRSGGTVPTAALRPPGDQTRPDLGTEAAIRRGQGLVQSDMYEFYSHLGEAEVDELPTAAGFERPSTIALTKQVPELDIRVLLDQLRPAPGRVSGFLMQWDEVAFRRFRLLFVDARFDELRIALASNMGVDDEHIWQRLPVHRQADGRLRFDCPVTHVRCDILYERGGLFASRQAQRVVHASQRGVKRRAGKPHD